MSIGLWTILLLLTFSNLPQKDIPVTPLMTFVSLKYIEWSLLKLPTVVRVSSGRGIESDIEGLGIKGNIMSEKAGDRAIKKGRVGGLQMRSRGRKRRGMMN